MKSVPFRVVLGILCGAALLLAASVLYRSQGSDRAVAVTAGSFSVYEDELPADAAGEVAQLKLREYDIKVRAYQNLLVQRLLEAEAQKRGVTLDQLMEKEGKARSSAPSDADVKAYFEEKKANYEQGFEQIKDRVRSDLAAERMRDGQRKYVQELWRASAVEVVLPVPRFSVAPDAQRVRGNPKAPVMIVEFSDFQCPYCRRAQPTLNALLAKYQGQVALSYRDYPLVELHPMAHVSAQAARCAGEQGKFWEYHELLFAETKRPDRTVLGGMAAKLNLDDKLFSGCLDGGTQKQSVDKDFDSGSRIGVSSTPVFFINGIYLSGALPQEEFERIIDRELKITKKP